PSSAAWPSRRARPKIPRTWRPKSANGARNALQPARPTGSGGRRLDRSIADEIGRSAAAARRELAPNSLAVVASGHEQPISIFQQLARGDSSGRNDAREVPAVAAQRRGSFGRARDRTSAMRPSDFGGTDLARCSPPRSERGE